MLCNIIYNSICRDLVEEGLILKSRTLFHPFVPPAKYYNTAHIRVFAPHHDNSSD